MKLNKIYNKIIERIGLSFIGKYLEYEFKNKQKNSYLNERPIEYEFVLRGLLNNKCLNVLDIGTGTNSFSSVLKHCRFNITATDLKSNSYWANFTNRHIHVIKDDITKTRLKEKFDAVLCISVLEHIPDFSDAVKGMVERLNDSGVLIMTFPYSHGEYCDNVYKLENADDMAKQFRYIGHSFSTDEIQMFCNKYEIEVVETQFAKGWTGKFWRTGERIDFPIKVDNPNEANLGCFIFKKIA